MTAADWDRLARDLEYPAGGAATSQEEYVRTFDFDPDCSLEIGWHLYGDAPERGAFMAALRADLEATGLSEGAELPDYLPTVLRLIARRDAAAAARLAGTIAPAVSRVLERLRARENMFAEPLAAVALALDGTRRQEERP